MGIICNNCGTKIWDRDYNLMTSEIQCSSCGNIQSSNFNEWDYYHNKKYPHCKPCGHTHEGMDWCEHSCRFCYKEKKK